MHLKGSSFDDCTLQLDPVWDWRRATPQRLVTVCRSHFEHVGCRLAEQEGVGTIFCLQEDSDMAYFDLDLQPILDRCHQRGDIKHVRCASVDSAALCPAGSSCMKRPPLGCSGMLICDAEHKPCWPIRSPQFMIFRPHLAFSGLQPGVSSNLLLLTSPCFLIVLRGKSVCAARYPIRDFDPFSLRQRLPGAVATLLKEAQSGRGKLYIHCTAGGCALVGQAADQTSQAPCCFPRVVGSLLRQALHTLHDTLGVH